MSIFNRVLHKHETRKAAQAEQSAALSAQAQQDREQFIRSFRSMTADVAKPLLDQFAHDAQARGYAALVKEGADRDGNPYISITFVPEQGAKVGGDPSNECVCQLKALPAEHVLECASCHDQRPGKDGTRILRADLRSINRAFLETHLEEFLTAALEAREAT